MGKIPRNAVVCRDPVVTCYICFEPFTQAQWKRLRSIRKFTTTTTQKFAQWKDYEKIFNTNHKIPPLGKYYHYDCLTSQCLKKTRVSPTLFDYLSPSGKRVKEVEFKNLMPKFWCFVNVCKINI